MLDIQQFLKKISTFNQIDIRGKESELGLFAQKYDKNKNSIFETEELQALKNDVQNYANKDGNGNELNDSESKDFMQSLMDKDKWDLFIQKTGENIRQYTTDLLNNLNYTGIENNKAEFIKKKLEELGDEKAEDSRFIKSLEEYDAKKLDLISQSFYVEGRESQFDNFEILLLAELSEEQFKKAEQLFYIKEKQEQFEAFEITELAKLTEEQFEKAKQLFNTEERKIQFNGFEIENLAKLSDEEFEKAKQLFNIEGRETQFNGFEITDLAKLPDIEFERAKKLFITKERKEQFSGFEIIHLLKLSDEEFKIAKQLFNIEGREKQFSGYGIAELAKLPDEQFKKAEQLFNIKGREQFDSLEIIDLIKLPEKEFEQAKKLFIIEERQEQFSSFELIHLAKLSDEELKKAEKLFNIKERTEQFDGYDIAHLVKLSDKEYKRAEKLFYVKNREKQFSGLGIVELAKLSDKEFKRAKKLFERNEFLLLLGGHIAELAKLSKKDAQWAIDYLGDVSWNIKYVVLLAKNHNKEIENLIPELRSESFEYTADEDSVKLLVDNKYYTYEKGKLIESGQIEELEDTKEMENCYLITILNTKSNIRQEIYQGEPAAGGREVVYKEIMEYLDDNGNVIKTVTLTRNPENGTLNVSEIGKDGIQRPVQWESVDSNSGATITQRDLTSPEGVKTTYYNEKSNNSSITDYVITDKNGKQLLNVHQTFEQISDNKFISSIRTTDKPEDTQIYEMEYTDDNKVKIFDKKNNTTTEIDLNNYIKDSASMEKLLPLIKQLPGQVLLEFTEKPFNIEYDETDLINGHWGGEKTLEIGNWTESVNEEENMFATLTHELGHYLDLYANDNSNPANDNSKFSNNDTIVSIFHAEFEEFKKHSTTEQQKCIDYLTNGVSYKRGNEEKVADAHSLLYSTNMPESNHRRLYLAQYFPRTIAAITKALLEEEGVKS